MFFTSDAGVLMVLRVCIVLRVGSIFESSTSGCVPRVIHFALGESLHIWGPIVVRKDAFSMEESHCLSNCVGGGRNRRLSSSFGMRYSLITQEH